MNPDLLKIKEEEINFAEILRQYFFDSRETQRDFAERFGVKESAVSLWVSGRNDPPIRVISFLVNRFYTLTEAIPLLENKPVNTDVQNSLALDGATYIVKNILFDKVENAGWTEDQRTEWMYRMIHEQLNTLLNTERENAAREAFRKGYLEESRRKKLQ